MHENRRRYWRRSPIIVSVNTVTNSQAGKKWKLISILTIAYDTHTHTLTRKSEPCQGHQKAADEADNFEARRCQLLAMCDPEVGNCWHVSI